MPADPTVPEQVYRDAARALVDAVSDACHSGRVEWSRADLADGSSKDIGLRAAVESAYRAGRTAAALAIRAHADKRVPANAPLNDAQRAFRRHLLAAAVIAYGPITPAEAAAALASGNVIVCRSRDVGGPAEPRVWQAGEDIAEDCSALTDVNGERWDWDSSAGDWVRACDGLHRSGEHLSSSNGPTREVIPDA